MVGGGAAVLALLIIALILALVVFFFVVGLVVKAILWLVLTLLIAGLASLAAQSFVKYRGSVQFTVISGLIGGVVGVVLANLLNVPGILRWPSLGAFPVLWAIVGSVIVVFVSKIVLPSRATGRRGSLMR
jgi:uncharacterized membrane protein YeaQ/YmgE (transglycosylase-associated protein family)